ncbi:proline-rich protein HaeIII subfamily 1-like [Melospiza melodia melodia]|uniref:proline-rich protein HaeIII subfamily 1-like n=1 Tax=Melospiza melodia melodia TaxID=1914991 RepID=UPI002FD02917
MSPCPQGAAVVPQRGAAAALGADPGPARGGGRPDAHPALPGAERARVPQVRLPVLPADLRGGRLQRGDTAGSGCRQRLHLPRALPAPPGPDRSIPEPGPGPPEPAASQGPGQAAKCQSEAAVTPLSRCPRPEVTMRRGAWPRGGGHAPFASF